MRNKLRGFLSGLFLLSSLVLIPAGAHAAGFLPEPTGKCPEDYKNGTPANLAVACVDGGERDYALDDIKSLLAIIGNFMISVSGAIVLFCFVLGGFFWIASAGNQKMVERGKGLISGAVIGTIIMVSAYTLVTFAVRTLVGSDAYSPAAQGPGAGPDPSQGSSIIKGNVTQIPAMYSQQGLCEKLVDDKATCQKANTCQTNYSLTGVCSAAPNQVGEECCMPIKQGSQSTGCAKIGGTCQEKTKPCGGVMASGLCLGGASVQCCIPI